MPAITVLIGLMLILVGIGGFGYGYAKTAEAHFTALIPAVIGLLILLCGVIAIFKENLRKHLMHAALVIALLGSVATTVTVFTGNISVISAPLVSKLLTVTLCLVLVLIGVRSFIVARRNRVD